MKSRATLVLAAVLSTLVFTACKKPPEPSTPPAAPEPKSQAESGPGTTPNFETPAPAEAPQSAVARVSAQLDQEDVRVAGPGAFR